MSSTHKERMIQRNVALVLDVIIAKQTFKRGGGIVFFDPIAKAAMLVRAENIKHHVVVAVFCQHGRDHVQAERARIDQSFFANEVGKLFCQGLLMLAICYTKIKRVCEITLQAVRISSVFIIAFVNFFFYLDRLFGKAVVMPDDLSNRCGDVKNPYFGYQRAVISQEELRELDNYCDALRLELIPCIQILAHLNTFFYRPDSQKYRDCEDILLVNDEEVYKLIDSMLASMSSCVRSRRINIGMDEAAMLGRGNYLA